MADCQTHEKLKKCEVCDAVEAKYTCPKCEVRTCSLPCVAKHKKELNCDGIRNKISFKAISQMTNLDVLSDYRLLEDVTRSVSSYQNDKMKRFRRFDNRLHRLRAAAMRRRITLKFLPQHFTRHKENTSELDDKQRILWRVQWVFPQADSLSCVDEKLTEEASLGMQLDEYLRPDNVDKTMKTRLMWYQAAGALGLTLLLKAESVPKAATKFYELDPGQSLRDNLSGKTIIEYPVIYVILNGHRGNYDILDSGEEEAIPTRQETRENLKSSHESRNLLSAHFDDSDSDETPEKKPILGLDIPFYEQLTQL